MSFEHLCAFSRSNLATVLTGIPRSAYKKTFFEKDKERFIKYLKDVSLGRKKISGATLFPHELLIEAICIERDAKKICGHVKGDALVELTTVMNSVIDAQWNSMVNSIRESASSQLSNCIAVVDVSGSMGDIDNLTPNKNNPQPIAVAISLVILLAQLSKPPFNGAYITFSAKPQICRLPYNANLLEIAQSLNSAHWQMNTAFHKVFDLLLEVATKHHLKPDDMIKKVFVFSDMQFDAADKDKTFQPGSHLIENTQTSHQSIKHKFIQAGYTMPDLVYWNIRGATPGSESLPVRADEPGVEVMSGFSASLMKIFLQAEQDEDLAAEDAKDEEEFDDLDKPTEKKKKSLNTPADKLRSVLDAPAFDKLKVVD